MTAASNFTFDPTGALARQLEAALPGLTQAPLTLDALEEVQAAPGIYRLYLRGELIYIGKADKSLRVRLADHHKEISGQLRISIHDMSCTGLYLEGTWIPVGPEQMLINTRNRMTGAEPLWNTNGFGMNDPGRERDTTNFKGDHFDAVFPADLGYEVEFLQLGIYPVSQLLPVFKQALPYVFRYENQCAKHPDYLASQVTIPQSLSVAFAGSRRTVGPARPCRKMASRWTSALHDDPASARVAYPHRLVQPSGASPGTHACSGGRAILEHLACRMGKLPKIDNSAVRSDGG